MTVRRFAGALVVAALVATGFATPATAQSCADFGSQKDAQRSLEQVGDPSGQLDPDGNGFACDSVPAGGGGTANAQSFQGTVLAQDAGPNTIVISDDGQSVSNNASGTSNTVIANPGGGNRANREARAPREERDRPERERRAGGAEAPVESAAPAEAFAPMGEPVGEGFVEEVAPAAPAEGGQAAGSQTAPIRLPSTGSGPLGDGVGWAAPAALLLALMALAGARWRGHPAKR